MLSLTGISEIATGGSFQTPIDVGSMETCYVDSLAGLPNRPLVAFGYLEAAENFVV